jgi:hypothetical protein
MVPLNEWNVDALIGSGSVPMILKIVGTQGIERQDVVRVDL